MPVCTNNGDGVSSDSQGTFHVGPKPDIFFRIILLCHDKAGLEMVWPSHTRKPS